MTMIVIGGVSLRQNCKVYNERDFTTALKAHAEMLRIIANRTCVTATNTGIHATEVRIEKRTGAAIGVAIRKALSTCTATIMTTNTNTITARQ
ncbi:MAG TPA: hypothetical protein VG322_07485 [Candidatus Acidoferrales bacterium]|jgi:hypothetical protein|nr:hypothetical protein [Candidatus Acidoferrales bacterium]